MVKKANFVYFFVVFGILYISLGYVSKNTVSETVNLIFFIILILTLMFCNRGINSVKSINKNCLLVFCIMIVISVMSLMLNQDNIKKSMYEIIVLLLSMIFVSNSELNLFKKYFVKVTLLVSIISILTAFVGRLFPSLLTIFPIIKNTGNGVAYNLFFCVVPIGYSMPRIQGFCWEPGAFQTILNLALPMLIFDDEEKNRKLKILVIFIALTMTMSLTGYLGGGINFILLLMKNRKSGGKSFLKFIVILMLGILGLYLIYPYVPNTINGVSFGFYKIKEFLQGTSKGSFDSASVRFDSVYYPLKVFANNALFGGGYVGLEEISKTMLHSMFTCTPINYFAVRGIIYGSIFVYGWYRYCTTISDYWLHRVLLVVGCMLNLFSEQYMNYIFVGVFLMYGFLYMPSEKMIVDRGEIILDENN